MTVKDLRAHAEDALGVTRREVTALGNEDVQRLVYELQVHHVELEMQNESLRDVQLDLEQSQAQYQMLFERAPVGYVTLNARDSIVRANRAAHAIFGRSSPELVGVHISDLLSRDDTARLTCAQFAADRGTTASCEVSIRSRDCSTRQVRLDVSGGFDQESQCLVVLSDISERKQALDEMELLNRQLAANSGEMDARNRELAAEIERSSASERQRRALEARLHESERLESVGLLAAGIAHDFNNLLVSVLGNTELLLQRPELAEDWRAPLSLIKLAGQHGSELSRRLLDFAGNGALNMTAVDLCEVVADNVELLRTRLPDGVDLHSVPPTSLPHIEADPSQVNQVVLNLITNAIEAVDGSGTIDVRTRLAALDREELADFRHRDSVVPGQYMVLQVQDDGPGMDVGTVARIFDPFFSTKLPGRGLGLASVLGIVHSHNGGLRVRSAPCAGTCFEVAFPLSRRAASHGAPRAHAIESQWTGTGHVLVIDDDASVREVIARLLVHLGFEVTVADGGANGVELLRHAAPRFRFVVLDWMMPGFSGQQVLKTLRVFEPELPVVVLSGYGAEHVNESDAHVVSAAKPVTLDQLRHAIGQAIGCHGATKH